MKRNEEIENAAKSYTLTVFGELDDFSDVTDAYIAGAKWADEHPNLYNDEKYHTVKVSCLDELNRKAKLYDAFLDKACEWLKLRINVNVPIETNENGEPLADSLIKAQMERLKAANEFVAEFRQAMEGE